MGATATAAEQAKDLGIHASPSRPDASGRFGKFGGKYVPETLIVALTELEQAYAEAIKDPAFTVRGICVCWLICRFWTV